MQLIDNINHHPTPEGLSLTLVPAGIMPRLSAWLVDLTIRLVCIKICFEVLLFFGNTGWGFILIIYFLLDWFYAVFFEVYQAGMTPGKKINNIYVCHDDGTPISIQSSLIRNLLRYADFMPFFFVGGALTMLFNKKSQRLGDMVAGTLVVYRLDQKEDVIYKKAKKNKDKNKGYQKKLKRYKQAKQIDSVEDLAENDPEETVLTGFDTASPLFTFGLTYKEQEALLAFSERLPYLSSERQQEIAEHLQGLITIKQQPDLSAEQIRLNAVQQKVKNIKGQ